MSWCDRVSIAVLGTIWQLPVVTVRCSLWDFAMLVVLKRGVNHVIWAIEGTNTVSMKGGGVAAGIYVKDDNLKAMRTTIASVPWSESQIPPVTHCWQVPSISSRLCCILLASKPCNDFKF